jgi:hypothetical protein
MPGNDVERIKRWWGRSESMIGEQGEKMAQTKKAEDFGLRHIQTIYQGDTSLYFGVSINE